LEPPFSLNYFSHAVNENNRKLTGNNAISI
jgi:hypothetical protein